MQSRAKSNIQPSSIGDSRVATVNDAAAAPRRISCCSQARLGPPDHVSTSALDPTNVSGRVTLHNNSGNRGRPSFRSIYVLFLSSLTVPQSIGYAKLPSRQKSKRLCTCCSLWLVAAIGVLEGKMRRLQLNRGTPRIGSVDFAHCLRSSTWRYGAPIPPPE